MIIGSGMMAQAFAPFRDDRNVLVFASGVSDSLETHVSAIQLELSLEPLYAGQKLLPEMLEATARQGFAIWGGLGPSFSIHRPVASCSWR